MEFSISIDDKQFEVKQTVTESEYNFTRRFAFILSALDSGIMPERAKTLSFCFLNRILFESAYSSELETEINNVVSAMENSPLNVN